MVTPCVKRRVQTFVFSNLPTARWRTCVWLSFAFFSLPTSGASLARRAATYLHGRFDRCSLFQQFAFIIFSLRKHTCGSKYRPVGSSSALVLYFSSRHFFGEADINRWHSTTEGDLWRKQTDLSILSLFRWRKCKYGYTRRAIGKYHVLGIVQTVQEERWRPNLRYVSMRVDKWKMFV